MSFLKKKSSFSVKKVPFKPHFAIMAEMFQQSMTVLLIGVFCQVFKLFMFCPTIKNK